MESWQQGVNIRPIRESEFASESFQRSLLYLAQANANFVSLLIPLYQPTRTSTDIGPGQHTPTDRALVDGIRYAKALGFGVGLKFHMVLDDNGWRAEIDPPDREGWFRAYQTWVEHYADIAEEHDVDLIVVGAELARMSNAALDPTNTEHWRTLIQSIRQRYSGSLTYSANWGGGDWRTEKDFIEFWDDLDYIGISAFFEFGPPYTLESLLEQWERWDRRDVRPLVEAFDRPVLFTELGYRSVEGALAHPWDHRSEGRPNQEEQALAYEAFFAYWDRQPFVRGVHLWDWPTGFSRADAQLDTDYTPQFKLATEVIAEWFAPGLPSALETAEAHEARAPEQREQEEDRIAEAREPGAAQGPWGDDDTRGPNFLLLGALAAGALMGWGLFVLVRR